VNLHLNDIADHLGAAYRVEALISYQLAGQTLRLARLVSGPQTRFLALPTSELADRLPLFSPIPALDLTMPPPSTIYHGGESFLLRIAGTATVTIAGQAPGFETGTCELWRYRAAGDRFLQIESWPQTVRMFEGTSVHRSMLDIRPATT
jgi:hypothetical protein